MDSEHINSAAARTNLRIAGTGAALPERCVTNDELSRLLDTSDEWIVTRTGIRERRVVTTDTITQLAVTAARQALAEAEVNAEQLDVILCSTLEGDTKTPSLACVVAGELGAHCAAFDVNAACAGFIYALDIASRYLQTGASNVLIICAEQMSRHADWTDRRTCVLFGDGAGAVVAQRGGELRHLHISTDGDDAILNIPTNSGNSPFAPDKQPPQFLHMDGGEVYKFAVKAVLRELDLAARSGINAEDIDLYIIHQANRRIIDAVRERTGQPPEKFPVNIDRTGNMSSATIPVLLHELTQSGTVKSGQTLFFAAFGAGLTSGGCVLTIGKDD
ncbi:MAG: ketoacyl-ACP synthase III [Oscillospiraceae bacterium]|jgi:3-oxoacyl-[acyl-carrier-protein] synthase-3|nr:ketoacyl-ACP synthase III [Oscillospiraceae bacterium]